MPAYGNYEGPEIEITVQGDSVRIRSQNTSTTIAPGDSGQIRLQQETVLIRFHDGEIRQIVDLRLADEPHAEGNTRRIKKTSVEQIDVEPIAKINNIGYAQVYSNS